MKFILAVIFGILQSLNANADGGPGSLFLTCTRDTQDFRYEVKVYRMVRWQTIAPGDDRSENRTEVVRIDRSGRRSVRNYNDGDMHSYSREKRMWISLSRKHTGYGQLNLEFGPRRKIKSAVLELYEGAESRNLELECTLEEYR